MDGHFNDSGHSQVYHLDRMFAFDRYLRQPIRSSMDVELDHDSKNTMKYKWCQLFQNLHQLRYPLPASHALYCFFIERVAQLAPQVTSHYC
jgi:hypothetical protein